MAPLDGKNTAGDVDRRVIRTRGDVLRVALQVLLDDGPDAVTHAHIARVAGYSKATLYTHWPSRAHLIHDAFNQLRAVPHHTPTGDLRTDLIKEMITFRTAVEEDRLDRALAALVGLTLSVPELSAVRDKVVADGERVVRELLSPTLHGADLEAATLMLCGALTQSALMRGRPPGDYEIEAAVDLVLRGGVVAGR